MSLAYATLSVCMTEGPAGLDEGHVDPRMVPASGRLAPRPRLSVVERRRSMAAGQPRLCGQAPAPELRGPAAPPEM